MFYYAKSTARDGDQFVFMPAEDAWDQDYIARRPAAERNGKLIWISVPFDGCMEDYLRRMMTAAMDVSLGGDMPFAPTLMIRQLYGINEPWISRKEWLEGIQLMPLCDEVWVYGNRMAANVSAEILWARKLGKTICFFKAPGYEYDVIEEVEKDEQG